jgi:hypothetical protein
MNDLQALVVSRVADLKYLTTQVEFDAGAREAILATVQSIKSLVSLV